MADSKSGSETLSLNTPTNYTPSESTDDAPPRYRDAVAFNGRRGSQSSSLSSPPVATSDWPTESVSDFSERQPFLSDGTSTPPPQYPGSRPSFALSVDGLDPLDEEVGELLLLGDPEAASPRTVCDDPRKGSRSRCRRSRSRSRGCSRWKRKDGKTFRVVISVLFVCILVGYLLGFSVVASRRRHRHNDVSQYGKPRPKWANEDCARKDGDFNHYEFNGIYDIELSDGPHGAFSGIIRVLPPLPGQTADLVMKQVAKKTKSLDVKVNGVISHAQALKERSSASSSSSFPTLEKRRGCHAQVLLYFRDGITINNLEINTHAGHVQVYSDLRVNGTTQITTKSGRVDADSFFNTRRTFITSGSSSLQGHFKLYDLLSISSTSGVIDVTVDPQDADPARPKPAELVVQSRSGRVHLGTSTRSPPARDYITTVESVDGQVHGTILHGSKTLIKTQSGMIDLDVLPYGDAASNLHTSSASGRQQVNVLSPVSATRRRRSSLGRMQSTHTSQSGALQLRYPAEWAGKIDGSTTSGAIGVSGHGVDILEKGQHYVRAEKDSDDGKSDIVFRAQSGSAELRF